MTRIALTAALILMSLAGAQAQKILTAVPLKVTAIDLITKVYGLADPKMSLSETEAYAQQNLGTQPERDGNDLWMESEAGYAVSYYGMEPQVEAVAQYENNALDRFGFFFLFPYAAEARAAADRQQCEFCSTLLQELHDLGLPLFETEVKDATFEVAGDFAGNDFKVRLVEEPDQTAGGGRFIVVVQVDPQAGMLHAQK